MTNKRDWLKDYREDSNKEVMFANNNKLFSKGVGNITIRINESDDPIAVENIMYVPELSANLLSVSTLVRKTLLVIFQRRAVTSSRKKNVRSKGNQDLSKRRESNVQAK
jgi:hypothetical protein